MDWHIQALSILNWTVDVNVNEKVDNVDKSQEDEEAQCPASSLEVKGEGYSHPTGY